MSGQDWTIHTTLRRRWHDGTEFTIRINGQRGVHLTITTPAGLKAHSHHPDVFMAKAHVDDLIASLTSSNAEDYRVDEPDADQLELA